MYLETLKVNKNSGTFHFTKYSGKKKKKKTPNSKNNSVEAFQEKKYGTYL